ncbi:ESPR-type extended signal peptide-containing protein [Candidatus Schmidhempelia bombi]|jgi:hypothetical protein|nr:ESPR-type extended signal peptide-containing protein [Candidatus Schmidhempelia bombi]
MNFIYRLIWRVVHQSWSAVGGFTQSHKKATTTIGLIVSSLLLGK